MYLRLIIVLICTVGSLVISVVSHQFAYAFAVGNFEERIQESHRFEDPVVVEEKLKQDRPINDVDVEIQKESLVIECSETSQGIEQESLQVLEYLLEIAVCGPEYAEKIQDARVYKWGGGAKIVIRVVGSPTPEDRETLREVVDEINLLLGETQSGVTVRIGESWGNVTIYFIPITEFKKTLPNYLEGNSGFFTVWYNDAGSIYKGTILIDSESPQEWRSHLIWEETTQILGLLRDSHYQLNSLFCDCAAVQQFAAIDRTIILMLYSIEVLPNMTRCQVWRTFTEKEREGC